MFFNDFTKNLLLRQPIKKDGCYEIAKRTCNFVMTYVGNRTINMTLVMLFLVCNKCVYIMFSEYY